MTGYATSHIEQAKLLDVHWFLVFATCMVIGFAWSVITARRFESSLGTWIYVLSSPLLHVICWSIGALGVLLMFDELILFQGE